LTCILCLFLLSFRTATVRERPEILLQHGLLALQRANLQEARTDLEQAERLDPKNPYIWASLAQVYLRLKEPNLASGAAGRAESLGQDNPVIWHALAMYYSEAGQFARAAKLEQRYAGSPRADANARSRAAELYLQAGDPQSAWQTDKTDPQIAFDWAQALLRRSDFTPAAQVIETALAAHPNDVQLMLALGVARYGQRRFEDAIKAFLRVIQLDPQIEQPYVFLGRMLDQAQALLPEITRDYETWLTRNPNNPKAPLLLAEALLTENNKGERAESLLRRSITLNPNDWESHYQLGVLLENKHDYPAAATQLTRAAELNPNEPMPHYHLARVYDRMGQPALAQAEREKHKQLTTINQPAR
jgi:Flp pilus assembly protein TadD